MLRAFCFIFGCLLAGLLPPAQAQTAPDAGQLLRENTPVLRPALRDTAPVLPAADDRPPPLAMTPGLTLRVNAVRVAGARTQSDQTLEALVADAVGRDLDFAALQALADRITAHYREAGYPLARAYLPAQDLAGGVVEIAVQEGRLGQLTLNVDAPFSTEAVAARLARLQPGQPLRSEALEADLLALSDTPGLRVQSLLRPGESVGSSDLDIQVTAGERLSGNLGVDNNGNRYTGAARVSGRVAVAHPFFFGDSLETSAVSAGSGYRYLRMAYQAPVAASGWQLGIAQSGMNYRLGESFASLNARGSALDSTVYALKSLQRSRAVNIDLNLAYDHKRFDDAANGVGVRKRSDVVSATVAGRWLWPEAVSSGSLGLTAGRLGLDAAPAAADAQGHRTAGGYARLGWQAGHEQALPAGFGVALRSSGQVAANNLDSSEKMALGGPQAVRAYPQGEATSDDAALASAELYRGVGPVRAKAFVDAGAGRNWHRPLDGDTRNVRRLAGAGFGVDATLPGDVQFQAVAAWRISGRPTSDTDRRPRLWAQINKSF